jgi:hypothetical protein
MRCGAVEIVMSMPPSSEIVRGKGNSLTGDADAAGDADALGEGVGLAHALATIATEKMSAAIDTPYRRGARR